MLIGIILSTAFIGCADISYTLKETTEDTGVLTAISGVQPQQTSEITTEASQTEPSDEIEAPSEDTAISEEIFEDTGVYEDTALEEELEDEAQDDWELFAESDFASGGLYPFATNGCAGIGCPTISNGALYLAGDWNSIIVDPSYGDWFTSGTSWAFEIDVETSAYLGSIMMRFSVTSNHQTGGNQGQFGIITNNPITIQDYNTYRVEVNSSEGFVYNNENLVYQDQWMPQEQAGFLSITLQRSSVNAQPTGARIASIRVYSK
jgi:hypothetical protein